MLSPVSTASNSSLNLQDMRSQAEAGSNPALPGPSSTQAARSGLDQNMTIAGRINMLLLSAPERMSQNLAVLVDVLGRALKLDRQPEESLTAYAARLLAAMDNLDPQQRSNLQKLLYQSFAGLQLRTLLEAFRNLAGPEAATLSIYLELHRQKEKDLVARSVVGSYRQNDGEKASAGAEAGQSRPLADLPPQISRAQASVLQAAGTGLASATPTRPAASIATAGVVLDGEAGLTGEGRPQGPASDPDRPAARAAGGLVGAVAEDEAPLARLKASAKAVAPSRETIANITPRGAETAREAATGIKPDVSRDAQRSPAVEASRIADLRNRQIEAGIARADLPREPRGTQLEVWPTPIPSRDDPRLLPTSAGFRQWSEAVRAPLPLPGGRDAEKGANSLIASLLSMVVPDASAHRARSLPEGALPAVRDPQLDQSIEQQMAFLEPEEGNETPNPGARASGFEEKVMVALTGQGLEAAQMRPSQTLPGLGLPFVTYMLADDEPDTDAAETERQQHDDDESAFAQGDGQDGQAPDDGAETGEPDAPPVAAAAIGADTDNAPLQTLRIKAGHDLPDSARALPAPAMDGAAGLYFRMVDWS